jgi:hypothetical protein
MACAGWSVVQTPAAAGLAWYLAHTLLGHHQPFFAPTAAAVSLSKNKRCSAVSVPRVGIRGPGRRRRRQCQPGGPARHPGPGAGGWHCPGGRPRAGERPALAAGREARRDLR